MEGQRPLWFAVAVAVGCANPAVDCAIIDHRFIAFDEVSPLGFRPSEAAAALSVEATIPITYQDAWGGSTALTITLVPNFVGVPYPPPRGEVVRPYYMEWAPEDGSELPGCARRELALGSATVHIRTADERIDQELTDEVVLSGALEGSTVVFQEHAGLGGASVGSGHCFFFIRFDVVRTADAALQATTDVVNVDCWPYDPVGVSIPLIRYGWE